MHYAVNAYMITDYSNYYASPSFNSALVVHHVASVLITTFSLQSPVGSGIGAFNIAALEFGSLWINICALAPSRFVYQCRLYTYTVTRFLVAVMNAYMLYFLPRSRGAVLIHPSLALWHNNINTAITLFRRSRSTRKWRIKRMKARLCAILGTYFDENIIFVIYYITYINTFRKYFIIDHLLYLIILYIPYLNTLVCYNICYKIT